MRLQLAKAGAQMPAPAFGSQHPWAWPERTSSDTYPHTLTSLFLWKQMQEALWLLPPLFLHSWETNQWTPPPALPPPSPCEAPGDAHGARAGGAPSTLLCIPFSTSGIFSPPPEAWKQPGQTRPFARHSHHVPTTIP